MNDWWNSLVEVYTILFGAAFIIALIVAPYWLAVVFRKLWLLWGYLITIPVILAIMKT